MSFCTFRDLLMHISQNRARVVPKAPCLLRACRPLLIQAALHRASHSTSGVSCCWVRPVWSLRISVIFCQALESLPRFVSVGLYPQK